MIDYSKMVAKCDCGETPFVKEFPSGQGEFTFIIKCKHCNKKVCYSIYDEGYIKAAIKEWNKFTRLSLNPIQSYCEIIFKHGSRYTDEEVIDLLKEKFKINTNDANLYAEKYIWSKVFMINCDFFKYRYKGILPIDYIPIVQNSYKLDDETIQDYHNKWLLNMEKTNGRYLEEGVDYSKNQSEEKKKLWTIFERDPKKK